METATEANAVEVAKGASASGGRLARWTQKMLDFSARNRLLNVPKKSRQVLRLMGRDVAGLEDRLADGREITVRSICESLGAKAQEEFLAGKYPQDKCDRLVADELEHGRLCVALPEKDVRRRLSDLLHQARTDIEESGVNTLFLALGELQWVEAEGGSKGKAYQAPVLMVPVQLKRASMSEGVRLRRLDEETTVNLTLVEFLRTQFGIALPGLDPLPTDEKGVDAQAVMKILREAIRGREGWDVLDGITLGCFSFGKFVMWKDLTDRVDELRRHPLVRHLIDGGGLYDDGVEVFPAEDVAKHLDPANLYCPVSYDSSQLAAVLYSAMGKTFVLHGPPGTGKSQTITNMIAHNLALGRRVLFVSEKKAALDVVKERLDRIGLTPFCLELHSNKTEKKRFYAQIREALEVRDASEPRDWPETIAGFERCRAELDAYVSELHRAYPNGLAAYDCFVRAIAHHGAARPELVSCDCLKQTREQYLALRAAVEEFARDSRGVSAAALRELPLLREVDWSPAFERQVLADAAALDAALTELEGPLGAVRSALGATGEFTRNGVAELVAALETREASTGEPYAAYRLDRLAEVDFASVAHRLETNAASFCLLRFFRNRALVRELGDIVRPGGRLTAERLAADLPRLKAYGDAVRFLTGLTGRRPVPGEPLPGAVREALAPLRARLTAVEGALDRLGASVEVSPEVTLAALAGNCRALAAHAGDLRGTMRCRKARARVESQGAGRLAEFLASEEGRASDALEVFDGAYAAKMLDGAVAGNRALAEFSGVGQDERVARFRELDARCGELARQVVFAKLAGRLPLWRGRACPKDTELGVLKRECEKKTRQKAVRQILAETRQILPSVKPCFLMSPLSVAQYLPVDERMFDLVVFDEASQIPVWDAVGVIARARQLVVVGDPKQMPPTNFFQKGDAGDGDDDEAEEDVVEDQESILDECLVAGVHSTYLNWHYRSRHESLIAFSNAHYYDGRLCTFPSAANSPRLGVKFVFVEDGRFARRGESAARVNEREAQALVDYVCTEVLKPDYRPRSLGIVTFSIHQRKLIQTLLEERRAADAKLEKLLPEEGEGAYFVKNLENVQGDESDVILFSVGYAPDEKGRFTMNFGPLNLAGGERRLNVAVTRAKQQVVVFSSIRGSQIDAGEGGRTRAIGAEHLKAFLEYAERGTAAPSASAPSAASGSAPFIETVATFLEDRGYEVDRNVGCSDFRIDLAVRDAKDPSRYVLGIECDGPSYAAQRTAQDRDVNRVGVLCGLGWRLYRAWSVDWAFDRVRAEERLLAQLREAEGPTA